MASNLATNQQVQAYVGNNQIADSVLDDLINVADAMIVDNFGAHPVHDAGEDTPTVSEQKTRDISRRRLALYSLVQLFSQKRVENQPILNVKGVVAGRNPLVENYDARVRSALASVGAMRGWAMAEETTT